MQRLLVMLAVAGCARSPAPLPPLAPEPARRVIFTSVHDVQTHEDRPYVPTCTRLVLAEQVMRRRGDRELELVVEVLDGDHESCGVGSRTTVHARDRRPPAFDPSPPGRLGSLLAGLYASLGTSDGTWTLLHVRLPLAHPASTTVEGGVTYRNYFHATDERFGGPRSMSEGHRSATQRMRVRVHDRRVACVDSHYDMSGSGEYGGFSQHSRESIAVDYGDATPPSCANVEPPKQPH